MFAATAPDTLTTTPVPSVADGTTSARSALTSVSVAASCGPVVGVTRMIAADADIGSSGVLGIGPTASATPSVWFNVSVSGEQNLEVLRAADLGGRARAVRWLRVRMRRS